MINRNVKYLSLLACCIPVKGHARGIIMDVQRNKYYHVPNDLIDVIVDHKENRIEEIFSIYENESETLTEYFEFLLENDLAHFIDTPIDFPPIPLNSWFHAEISNAILEVGELDILRFNISKQLSDLNCQWLEIRYLRNDYDYLIECLDEFQNTRIRSIELILTSPWEDSLLKNLIKYASRISRITIFNSENDQVVSVLGVDLIFAKGAYSGTLHCGNISRSEFSVNLPAYIESINSNSCLSNKISINAKGEIKNCPSMAESFGSIKNVKLDEVARLESFKKYWGYKKDMIKTCNICEYRYICTDCRAYLEDPLDDTSKPLKCGYNPHTATWEDWANDEKKVKTFSDYKTVSR